MLNVQRRSPRSRWPVPQHSSVWQWTSGSLPAAAVGLESTCGAAPYRVHAKHLGAAALAQDLIGSARRVRPIRRRRWRGRVSRFRHRANY